MEKKPIVWASFFPFLEEVKPTQDSRIFRTKPQPITENKMGPRAKMYFACVVADEGQNCYSVEVIAPYGADTRKNDDEAYYKVKSAVLYYEQHEAWPDKGSKAHEGVPSEG